MSEVLKQSMDEYGIQAWITLFSLLFDPEVDEEYKRRHASDVILFTDESLLYVAYRVMANGDLQSALFTVKRILTECSRDDKDSTLFGWGLSILRADFEAPAL